MKLIKNLIKNKVLKLSILCALLFSVSAPNVVLAMGPHIGKNLSGSSFAKVISSGSANTAFGGAKNTGPGFFSGIFSFVKNGVSKICKSKTGLTCLSLGALAICAIFLTYKFKNRASKLSPLEQAFKDNDTEKILKLCEEKRAKYGPWGKDANDIGTGGTCCGYIPEVGLACKYNNLEIINLLQSWRFIFNIKLNVSNDPLAIENSVGGIAIKNNSLIVLKNFIAANDDGINEKCINFLNKMVFFSGNLEMIKYLIEERKVKINFEAIFDSKAIFDNKKLESYHTSEFTYKDMFGQKNKDEKVYEVVKYLVESKACCVDDIINKSDGKKLIDYAEQYKNKKLVNYLKSYKKALIENCGEKSDLPENGSSQKSNGEKPFVIILNLDCSYRYNLINRNWGDKKLIDISAKINEEIIGKKWPIALKEIIASFDVKYEQNKQMEQRKNYDILLKVVISDSINDNLNLFEQLITKIDGNDENDEKVCKEYLDMAMELACTYLNLKLIKYLIKNNKSKNIGCCIQLDCCYNQYRTNNADANTFPLMVIDKAKQRYAEIIEYFNEIYGSGDKELDAKILEAKEWSHFKLGLDFTSQEKKLSEVEKIEDSKISEVFEKNVKSKSSFMGKIIDFLGINNFGDKVFGDSFSSKPKREKWCNIL